MFEAGTKFSYRTVTLNLLIISTNTEWRRFALVLQKFRLHIWMRRTKFQANCPKLEIRKRKKERNKVELIYSVCWCWCSVMILNTREWELLKLSFMWAFDTLKLETQEKDFSPLLLSICLWCIPRRTSWWSAAIWFSFSSRLSHFLLPQLLISRGVSGNIVACVRARKWRKHFLIVITSARIK